ncbi:hypothetical protein FIBSPDRAFT_948689 [Athelia psychrophila]|uniref:Nudix hydrolase domain-containing protein n=1 Tax=Athelia psychrophila TaxID=1759441 RepID=A0A166QQE3_9AGAM|nr:hypothetical protein FIBSPDRAFT_948689 [Fibularhizoctonia sp. CBS 109695]
MFTNALNRLSNDTQEYINRLGKYQPDFDDSLYSGCVPIRAAVLVLLYEIDGKIRVLLTTRSKNLRTHPGQTALPGGKADETTDKSALDTALREAEEEVGLPRKCPHIRIICALDTFVSKYKILVTPVVAFLTDVSVLNDLKASDAEVDLIFSHPLEALLDPLLASAEPDLVPIGSVDWPYDVEYHNSSDASLPWCALTYRMHRFRSAASPIKGMTSDVLIRTAEIAYAKGPAYQRWPTNQTPGFTGTHKSLAAVLANVQ